MWSRLGVTPGDVLVIVVTAVGIYAVFTALIRLIGQRSVARMTTSDVLIVLVLGAVGGRVITGTTPTLAAGAIALVALFALHLLVQRLVRTRWGGAVLRDRPLLLMANGTVVPENLRRGRVAEEDLAPVLRAAGVRTPEEVACVILEPAGALSVIRRGEHLDRALFADVVGVERIPAACFADEDGHGSPTSAGAPVTAGTASRPTPAARRASPAGSHESPGSAP